jgi:hypothetical protein
MEKRFKLHLYFFCWVSQSGVAMVAILISPPNNQKKKKQHPQKQAQWVAENSFQRNQGAHELSCMNGGNFCLLLYYCQHPTVTPWTAIVCQDQVLSMTHEYNISDPKTCIALLLYP